MPLLKIFKTKRVFYVCFFLFLFFCDIFCQNLPVPVLTKISYGEKMLIIEWDTVPGAVGYNLYSSPNPELSKRDRLKINQDLINSGNRYAYLWHWEKKKRVRKIKGYRHSLAVTAVFLISGKEIESELSNEMDNDFFKGFSRILQSEQIDKISQKEQEIAFLPVPQKRNSKEQFKAFMEGPGKLLHELYEDKINPLESGSCAPVSTVLIKLMNAYGLDAYKIEGTFITEYHSFIVINVEGVEYIVDFTADQFLPNVTPVIFPRDYSFLNSRGKLDRTGMSIYKVSKIYTADQTELKENFSADLYWDLYHQVAKAFELPDK